MHCRIKGMITVVVVALAGTLLAGNVLAQTGTVEQNVKILVAKANQCLRHESRKHLAVDYINRAVKLQPRNLQLYYKRAFIYGRLKYYTEAIKNLDFIVRSDPRALRFPSALKYRAECYAAIGVYGKAVTDYRTLLKHSSESGKVWFYYAELLWFLGDRQQALKSIDKGLKVKTHWRSKLIALRKNVIAGQRVQLHTPFSN